MMEMEYDPQQCCKGIMMMMMKEETPLPLEQSRDEQRYDMTSILDVDQSRSSMIALTATMMTTSSSNTTGRITFGMVKVLEFLPQIGDNPAVSSGCPIALGPYHNCQWMTVDSYEETYPSHKRRSFSQLRIPSEERTKMLLGMGHTTKEIIGTARDAFTIRDSRRRSTRQEQLDAFYGALVLAGWRIASKTNVKSI